MPLAGAPGGDFAVLPGDGPVALIGAGIGITPLVGMVHALAGSGRETHLLRIARDGAHAPFKAELRALGERHRHLSARTHLTRPREKD